MSLKALFISSTLILFFSNLSAQIHVYQTKDGRAYSQMQKDSLVEEGYQAMERVIGKI
jgi:hypothetical protein